MGKRVKRNKEKNKMKLWVKIVLIVIAVLIVGIGVYAYSIYHNAKKTVDDKMHEPIESIDTGLTKKKLAATDRLNILLLGIDTDQGDAGRSDAIMILSLNPKKDEMELISIPRDTRVTLADTGTEDKINHAYALGGQSTAERIEMSVATVENFLNIELDYYVSINMTGFKELVDQVGGITVHNDIAWEDGKYKFDFGPIEMDGDKTMAYVRMRKQDPSGDFGRTKRQRQVIQGLINKGATVGSVTKINGMIDILGNNMGTNMDFDDMKVLLTDYRDVRKNTNEYQMKGEGTMIDGIYYYIVGNDEVEKVREMVTEE